MAVLWLVLAMFMAIPWIVLLVENDPDAPAFGVSILIVLSATLTTWFLTRKVSLELKPWQMFVLTAASWVSITGFASLPLILGAPQLSITNAFIRLRHYHHLIHTLATPPVFFLFLYMSFIRKSRTALGAQISQASE